jgi:hypothetical protein
MGCVGQDKELGTLRAQIPDRSRQEAVAPQRAGDRASTPPREDVHRREIATSSMLRICSMASAGMPALPDIVIASDVATRATAQSTLLVSFIVCAAPGLLGDIGSLH